MEAVLEREAAAPKIDWRNVRMYSERKRTPFPREILYTSSWFVKDWEKLKESGKHNMHRIKEAISLLMMNEVNLWQ